MDVLKKVHPRGPNTFKALTDIETPDAQTAIFKLSEPARKEIKAFAAKVAKRPPRFEGR